MTPFLCSQAYIYCKNNLSIPNPQHNSHSHIHTPFTLTTNASTSHLNPFSPQPNKQANKQIHKNVIRPSAPISNTRVLHPQSQSRTNALRKPWGVKCKICCAVGQVVTDVSLDTQAVCGHSGSGLKLCY